ncbi:MAG: CmcJ/NvfI family oxidoreductase, partial [Stellaceae bacterium]
MVQVAVAETDPEAIEATLNYFVDTGNRPVSLVGAPGGTDTRTGGGQSDPRRVTLRNGRLYSDRFALERNGFRFVRHATKVADFYDEDQIRRVYYPEMEALVKAESGAARVVVFDHTLRTPDQELREAAKIREVVRRVHNDYTEWSAPKRVRDLLPDEAEVLLQRRFAIVQVWRPIRHPVECWPLAIADAPSLSPDDMVVTERRYQDRIGQTSAITYNPAHRWYWFPHMQPEEA